MTRRIDYDSLQPAARWLCEQRGVNPDAQVGHGAEPDALGFVPMVLLHSPAWVLAARELHDFTELQQAAALVAQKRGGAQ